MNYIIVKDLENNVVGVFEPSIGCIPIAEANTDYQDYLKWLSEGGVPLPAYETN